MNNIPKVKVAIVVVSRSGFSEDLSVKRRKILMEKYKSQYCADEVYECPICVGENELQISRVLKNIQKEECNALCIYLGNFGPEITETMLASLFRGPVMFCAAAEELGEELREGRGDAYCGLLNASYNLGIRNIRVYIPSYPIGTTSECAEMIRDFIPLARTIIGLKHLKVISFGPRPNNFVACNAPIKPLYDLGIEIEENSELDLFDYFQKHNNDKRIPDVVNDMIEELGKANTMPNVLPKLAQYELTLLDWVRTHKGNSKFVTLTSKCWPAFQTAFGFVPCYVNSRMTAKGFPVSCEADIYGALSEYIAVCIADDAPTIMDINNSVPKDMYEENIAGKKFQGGVYKNKDVFMGFHCGNTVCHRLDKPKMTVHPIMRHNLSEEIIQGTLEGELISSPMTMFRLQGTADAKISAYVVEGEILPISAKTYGSVGVFAVHEMGRFYRHVLIEKNYPHHAAIMFEHYGKYLYNLYRYLNIPIERIDTNYNHDRFYSTENPFEREE